MATKIFLNSHTYRNNGERMGVIIMPYKNIVTFKVTSEELLELNRFVLELKKKDKSISRAEVIRKAIKVYMKIMKDKEVVEFLKKRGLL